jgi:hypothetical protein
MSSLIFWSQKDSYIDSILLSSFAVNVQVSDPYVKLGPPVFHKTLFERPFLFYVLNFLQLPRIYVSFLCQCLQVRDFHPRYLELLISSITYDIMTILDLLIYIPINATAYVSCAAIFNLKTFLTFRNSYSVF